MVNVTRLSCNVLGQPILLIYSSIRQAFHNLRDKHVMIYSLLRSPFLEIQHSDSCAHQRTIQGAFRPPLSSVYLLVVYKALQLKSQRLGQL